MFCILFHALKTLFWTYLVVQWLRIYLPMLGPWVRSLVQEDSTCRGATEPKHHNSWARAPRQEKPPREACAPPGRAAPLATSGEGPCPATKTQRSLNTQTKPLLREGVRGLHQADTGSTGRKDKGPLGGGTCVCAWDTQSDEPMSAHWEFRFFHNLLRFFSTVYRFVFVCRIHISE